MDGRKGHIGIIHPSLFLYNALSPSLFPTSSPINHGIAGDKVSAVKLLELPEPGSVHNPPNDAIQLLAAD